MEPLTIPPTKATRLNHVDNGKHSNPFDSQRLSPDYARTLSQSTRRSPQTRRPREENELGAGYGSDAPGFRNRFSLHDPSTRVHQ